MKLYYNKTTGVLGAAAGATTNVQRIAAKRYADVEVELVPVDAAGNAELFASGASGLLVVKGDKEFTGAAKILDAAWDAPSVTGRGYVFAFVAAGAGIDAALGSLPSLAFALEIVVRENGKRIVLPTVSLVIENNYYREDEPAPADPEPHYPPPEQLVVEGQARGATRISAAGLELQDTATGVWRRLSFADGQLVFTEL